MKLPRVRFTIWWMMLAVAACAGALALLRIESIRGICCIVGGPVIGSLVHRALGGRGILGGMIGGVATFWGFVAFMYLRAFFYPERNTVDYIGPVLSFAVFGFDGAVIGLVVGVFIWWLVWLDESTRGDVLRAIGTGEASAKGDDRHP